MERISNILSIEGLKLGDLSDFLFNDKSYLSSTYFASTMLDRRPKYYTLEWMKDNIQNSNIFDLSRFVKKAVIMEINKWISENHFSTPYLAEKSTHYTEIYGKNIHIRDFRLFESICKVYIVHEQNPRLSEPKIKRLFNNINDITSGFTVSNSIMTVSDLQKILTKTEQFEFTETDQVKKSIYAKAIKEINDYLVHKEDAVKAYVNKKYLGSKTLQDFRELFEGDPGIMAFDVMMLLGRDLGTEPVFFDDLDQNIFAGTTEKVESFARQHIDPKKFWSLYVSRMFLSTRTYHGVYADIRGHGTVSILDQQICLEGMHILMERGLERKGHGIDDLINEDDIKEVFTTLGGGTMYTLKDERTVLEWWKHGSSTGVRQLENFDRRLKKFNNKIKFKRDNKIDSTKLFLAQFQKIAYDRFWNRASTQAERYYLLSRMKADLGLSWHLSIPDSDLMKDIFPERYYF
jgi:hypothetical protein